MFYKNVKIEIKARLIDEEDKIKIANTAKVDKVIFKTTMQTCWSCNRSGHL